jgi:hypothetical protein
MAPDRGRLGAAVSVGMGNTIGPGGTGSRCMFISLGGETLGLTGVQCGKRRGPQCCVCMPVMHSHNNISRKKHPPQQHMWGVSVATLTVGTPSNVPHAVMTGTR